MAKLQFLTCALACVIFGGSWAVQAATDGGPSAFAPELTSDSERAVMGLALPAAALIATAKTSYDAQIRRYGSGNVAQWLGLAAGFAAYNKCPSMAFGLAGMAGYTWLYDHPHARATIGFALGQLAPGFNDSRPGQPPSRQYSGPPAYGSPSSSSFPNAVQVATPDGSK